MLPAPIIVSGPRGSNNGTDPKSSGSNITANQEMLDENSTLIKTIFEYQNQGKHHKAMTYQRQLHRNLMSLAQLADTNQNQATLLPLPGQVPPAMVQQPGYSPPGQDGYGAKSRQKYSGQNGYSPQGVSPVSGGLVRPSHYQQGPSQGYSEQRLPINYSQGGSGYPSNQHGKGPGSNSPPKSKDDDPGSSFSPTKPTSRSNAIPTTTPPPSITDIKSPHLPLNLSTSGAPSFQSTEVAFPSTPGGSYPASAEPLSGRTGRGYPHAYPLPGGYPEGGNYQAAQGGYHRPQYNQGYPGGYGGFHPLGNYVSSRPPDRNYLSGDYHPPASTYPQSGSPGNYPVGGSHLPGIYPSEGHGSYAGAPQGNCHPDGGPGSCQGGGDTTANYPPGGVPTNNQQGVGP